MNRGTGLALTTAIVLSLYLLAVLSYRHNESRPAPRIQQPTTEERRMIKKAIRRHGDYPIIRDEETCTYTMYRKGERIRL